MRKTLKKYFIPHRENDHRPHILRWEATLVILGIILAAEVAFLFGTLVLLPKTDFFAAILPAVLVDLTNQNRQVQNLSSLKTNPLLEKAALLKAQDMAAKGYFSHNTPDGKTPWYWLEQVKYRYAAAGENLAVNFFDSQDAVNAWMNSQTHRANILNLSFTEIGIAAAKGTYQGRQTIFVVQFFGRPSLLPVALAASETPTPTPLTAQPSPQPQLAEQPKPVQPALVQKPVIKEAYTETEQIIAEVASIPLSTDSAGHSAPIVSRVLASPRNNLTIFYLTIATLITIALILKIFINIKIQHPRLIMRGIGLLLIIGSALVVNQYLMLLQTKII